MVIVDSTADYAIKESEEERPLSRSTSSTTQRTRPGSAPPMRPLSATKSNNFLYNLVFLFFTVNATVVNYHDLKNYVTKTKDDMKTQEKHITEDMKRLRKLSNAMQKKTGNNRDCT